jgi:hypothetical protein
MKTFTLFWRDGKVETVKGNGIGDAMTSAGYGAGSLGALDFYDFGDSTDKYRWNKEERRWILNKECEEFTQAILSEMFKNQ